MAYIIAGFIVLVCIVAIIMALRVFQDSRKMGSKKPGNEED